MFKICSLICHLGTNQKCVYDFLLVLNSKLGPILPCFIDIRAFVPKSHFLQPTCIPTKI